MLIKMPKLKRCFCTSIRNLNDNLRVLMIKTCPALEVFPLFDNCQQFKIEQPSWLFRLSKLVIHKCPHLHVHNPLPPSTNVSKLSITGVSTLPTVEWSRGILRIGVLDDSDDPSVIDEPSDQLITLDDKVLSFHNLRFLTELVIAGCQNLTSISLQGLRQLIYLRTLEIRGCPKLFSSNMPPELVRENMAATYHNALPSLEYIFIAACGITGKWLSLILQYAQALQDLDLYECEQITGLSIGEEESSQPNLMSTPETVIRTSR